MTGPLNEDGPLRAVSLQGLRYAPDGYLHGLGQRFLQARLRFDPPPRLDWTVVDDALRAALPDAEDGRPALSAEPTAGALQRVLHWTAEFQRASDDGVFEPGRVLWRVGETWVVALPTLDPNIADAALKVVVCLIDRALVGAGAAADVAHAAQAEIGVLQDEARRLQFNAMTISFLKAAHRRGMPWLQLGATDAVQVGHGARGRWLQASTTDGTSLLASQLSLSKAATTSVLRQVGIPAPAHLAVLNEDMAVEAAERLGYPVVVKPLDGGQGRGVRVNLRDAAAVRKAYAEARTQTERSVLVETFLPGRDYRMVVFLGKLVWALERVPGGVTGDGASTVRQLVDRLNADPRRSGRASAVVKTLKFNDEALDQLAEAGLTGESIPAAGQTVRLRGAANISQGGVAVPVFDQVHPDNRKIAERAAQTLRLDMVGLDLIVPDIARSWRETGGGICEVNASQDLTVTVPQHVFGTMLEGLVEGDGRIPIALLVGAGQGSKAAALVSRIVAAGGARVGLASADGAWIEGDNVLSQPADLFMSARLVLGDAGVDAAIVAVDDTTPWRTGLPFDRCAVAAFAGSALTDAGDSPGFDALARALLPMAGTAMINVLDAGCLALLPHVGDVEVVLYAPEAGHASVNDHRAGGGAAVWVEAAPGAARLIVARGALSTAIDLDGGDLACGAADIALAAAVASALGCDDSQLRAGLAGVRLADKA